jgi:hypothetical protein
MSREGALRFARLVAASVAMWAVAFGLARRVRGRWVFVCAPVVFASVLSGASPTLSHDAYHYIAEGRVLARYGKSPLLVAPASVEASDPILDAVYDWRETPSRAGTVHVAFVALASALGGGSVVVNLFALRMLYTLVYFAATLAVARLAPPGMSGPASVAFAWNPLILIEGIVNLHNDLLMAAFAVLGLWALARRRYVAVAALLTLSVLVKFATVGLALYSARYAARVDPAARRRIYAASVLAAVSGALLYLPFVAGSEALARPEGSRSWLSWLQQVRVTELVFTGGLVLSLVGSNLSTDASLTRLARAGAITTGLALAAFTDQVWPWYAITVAALATIAIDGPVFVCVLLLSAGCLLEENVIVWHSVVRASVLGGDAFFALAHAAKYGLVLFGLGAWAWRSRARFA